MKVMLARRDGGPGIGTDARTYGSTGAGDLVTVMVMIMQRATNNRSIMLGTGARF